MRKSFLICSLDGRIKGLIKLIISLREYTDWNVYVVLQQYKEVDTVIVKECLMQNFPSRHKVLNTDKMTGPHLARCSMLDLYESDIWCILDDDMYAVEGYTHYNEMAEVLYQNKNIGLLSSNWRRTLDMLRTVPLSDKLIKQNIVYTGGGMMLRQDVVDIIKATPRKQYLFDNPLWSIYTYVEGYDNYRYLGSASVHEICTKGGRRKWISENNKYKSLPPCEWINTRKGSGKEGGFDEYLICDSSDITELAHDLHRRNKK